MFAAVYKKIKEKQTLLNEVKREQKKKNKHSTKAYIWLEKWKKNKKKKKKTTTTIEEKKKANVNVKK